LRLIVVYFVLIFIQVLFGINFSASKVIVDKMDPFLWSNIRFLLAGLGMFVLSIVFRKKHPPITKDFLLQVFPLSILGMALGQGLFLFGLRYTSSINSAILITMIPILTLLIVVLRKQEQLTGNKLIGILLAFFGVIFMRDLSGLSFGSQTLWGDLLVFAGALCFAMYLSYGKKFFMTYDNFWSTTWMFIISGLCMSLFNIDKLGAIDLSEFSTTFYSCAGFSIFGATLLTYLLNNWSLKNVSSGSVALFIYLQPLVAGFIGYIFLNEAITTKMVVCGALIFIGVFVSIKKTHKDA